MAENLAKPPVKRKTKRKATRSVMGRPPKYETADDLEQAVDAYFLSLKQEGDDGTWQFMRPPTLNGIALHLGFYDRNGMYDQINRGDDFSSVIKKVRSTINSFHEERLASQSPTGSIFFLKCRDPEFREPAAKHMIATKRVEDMNEDELVVFLGDDD